MLVLPIATFLAGALLTLLMPVALLIALVSWYWFYVARVPGPPDASDIPPASERPGEHEPAAPPRQ